MAERPIDGKGQCGICYPLSRGAAPQTYTVAGWNALQAHYAEVHPESPGSGTDD